MPFIDLMAVTFVVAMSLGAFNRDAQIIKVIVSKTSFKVVDGKTLGHIRAGKGSCG